MILKALDVLFQMPPVSPSNSLWFRRYEFLKFWEVWTQNSSTSTCAYATVEVGYLQVEVGLGSSILQGPKVTQGQQNCKVWALYDMGYSTWVTLRNVFNLGPKIEKFGPPISKNPAQLWMHGRVECFSGLISHVLRYLKKKYKKFWSSLRGGYVYLKLKLKLKFKLKFNFNFKFQLQLLRVRW